MPLLMSDCRSIVHRTALWIAAATLALTVYVASYPFSFYWLKVRLPKAAPVMLTLCAPLDKYIRHPELIGSDAYDGYCVWVLDMIQEPTLGDLGSSTKLNAVVSTDFNVTPLQDVIAHLGELTEYPIELESDVERDIKVGGKSSGQLRDVLRELLEPLGLVAWPADGRIAIGTPAAIQRVRAEDRAQHPLPTAGWLLLALFCVSAGSLVILLRGRRGANQISMDPTG